MKLDITQLAEGSQVTGELVVKSSTVRQTKTGKNYLSIVFTDGTSDINANAWDWSGIAIQPNTVVNVEATVGSWAGKKQLTANKVSYDTVSELVDFLDDYVDTTSLLERTVELIGTIQSDDIRVLVDAIYADFQALIVKAPGAISAHHHYIGGCLEHSYGVAKLAGVLATMYGANYDLCIAGGLLHDIGKIFEYAQNGVSIETTIDGHLLYHIPLGAILVDRYRNMAPTKVVKLLQHIILSHHGQKEYGSPVVPKCLEAMLVHMADDIDAKSAIIKDLNSKATGDLTEKSYLLGNTPFVTQEYVEKALNPSLV